MAAGVGALFYIAAKAAGLPLELTLLGWIVYLLICDGLPGGQSLGKKFTRSAVVHVDTGRPCNYLQSFVRNLCLIILGVIDCAFIAGKQRRRLGDFIARTKVVRLAH